MRYLLAVAVVLVAACQAPVKLAPEAASVVVTKNQTLVTHCKLLGDVAGSSGMFLTTPNMVKAEAEATVDLKNRAQKLGGNTVWITKVDTDRNAPGYSTITGEAYRCDGV
jgi:uncharacterized protein DUF4156